MAGATTRPYALAELLLSSWFPWSGTALLLGVGVAGGNAEGLY